MAIFIKEEKLDFSMLELGFPSEAYDLEQALHPDIAREPSRGRGCQPPVAAPRRIHPPARGGNLQLPVSGAALAAENHADCAPGNGRHRRTGDRSEEHTSELQSL